MARARYDDWNFMGESLDNTSRTGSALRIKHLMVLFSVSFLILLLLGLASAYSASYPQAFREGLVHYHYLVRQIIFVAVGMVAGAVLILLPEAAFRFITPMFMFGSLILFSANFFIKSTYMEYESIFALIVLSVVMYLSLYFANRENHISRLRELMFPMLFSVVFVFLIAVQQDVQFLVQFLAIVIIMFAIGGVGFGGVLLLMLYALVPSVCWVLADSAKLDTILNQLVPGLRSADDAAQSVLRQQSLSSGDWFGRGLGMGLFKLENLDGISTRYILCNVAEELGFAGILAIFILFMTVAYAGYRCSYYTRNYSLHYSNLSAGLTTIILWQFLTNVAIVFGVLPFRGISLPFFSVGSGIAVVVVECALIMRCMLRGLGKKEERMTELILSEDEPDALPVGYAGNADLD